MSKPEKLSPIPPGEMLRDALNGAGFTINAAALKMGISYQRLSGIVNGHAAITPYIAERLARLFDTSAQLWLNLETRYERELAEDQ